MPTSPPFLPSFRQAHPAPAAGLGPHALTGSVLATGLTLIAIAAASAQPGTLWLLVGAPLCEEVVFRAGLQEALLRRWPLAPAARPIALTALLFASAHALARPGALVAAAATAVPALALGALYQRQRRWWPCAALHALFNLIWLTGAPLLGNRLF